MIQVMLADDNKYALTYFSGLVDWEALGFSLVGAASDGIEAYQMFQEYKPDVVITDVQMPGMDGKELARHIREEAPETVVIFLSSYDAFDYARSAVDLNVNEYILKHELDEESMTCRLQKLRREIEERRYRRNAIIRSYLVTSFHIPENDRAQEIFG